MKSSSLRTKDIQHLLDLLNSRQNDFADKINKFRNFYKNIEKLKYVDSEKFGELNFIFGEVCEQCFDALYDWKESFKGLQLKLKKLKSNIMLLDSIKASESELYLLKEKSDYKLLQLEIKNIYGLDLPDECIFYKNVNVDDSKDVLKRAADLVHDLHTMKDQYERMQILILEIIFVLKRSERIDTAIATAYEFCKEFAFYKLQDIIRTTELIESLYYSKSIRELPRDSELKKSLTACLNCKNYASSQELLINEGEKLISDSIYSVSDIL